MTSGTGVSMAAPRWRVRRATTGPAPSPAVPYRPRTMLCDLPGCGHGFGRRVFAGRHRTRTGQRHPVSAAGRAADVAEDLAGEVAGRDRDGGVIEFGHHRGTSGAGPVAVDVGEE